MLRFRFLPAKRNTWGEEERGETGSCGEGEGAGFGGRAVCPAGPAPIFAPDPPSAWVVPPPPPPRPVPLSHPPSSPCPGAGSRKDTGPDPCPSCPGSACSAPCGPGGLAEARTPGGRPLPRVGMGPSPPSGSAQGVYQPQGTRSPRPQQVPRPAGPQAGRPTHRFLLGREQWPARVQPACPQPAAPKATLEDPGELRAFLLFCLACG